MHAVSKLKKYKKEKNSLLLTSTIIERSSDPSSFVAVQI